MGAVICEYFALSALSVYPVPMTVTEKGDMGVATPGEGGMGVGGVREEEGEEGMDPGMNGKLELY